MTRPDEEMILVETRSPAEGRFDLQYGIYPSAYIFLSWGWGELGHVAMKTLGLHKGISYAQAIDEIQQFSDNLPDTIDAAREQIQDWYDEYVPEEHHDRVEGWLTDFGDAAGDWAAGLAPDVLSFAGDTFTIIIGYLTIPIWLYFTLKDHPRGVRSFIGMFPPDWRHDVRNVLGIADAVLRNYIRAMLLQGMIIGVVGTVVGATSGAVISWLLDRYRVISIPSDVYQVTYLPFKLLPVDAITVVIGAVIVCFVATLYPSRQAAKLDPAQALRFE